MSVEEDDWLAQWERERSQRERVKAEWRSRWVREHFARHPEPGPDATPAELRELIGRLRTECYNVTEAFETIVVPAQERTTRNLFQRYRSDVLGTKKQKESTGKRLATRREKPRALRPIEKDILQTQEDDPNLKPEEIAERLWPIYEREYDDPRSIANLVWRMKKRNSSAT